MPYSPAISLSDTAVSKTSPRSRLHSEHWPEIDGLRGLAIVLVLCYHLFSDGVRYIPILGDALRLGWSGVDLFFVLSGFLVGGILLDNRESPSYFKTFYMRRACRILPLYFVTLCAIFLILHFFPANFAHLALHPPKWPYATFTQDIWYWIKNQGDFSGLTITWTLAIEEKFYLLIPFVIRFLAIDRLKYFLWASLALSLGYRIAFSMGEWGVGFKGIIRWEGLIAGVLLAIWYRSPGWKEMGRYRTLGWCLMVALMGEVMFRKYWADGQATLWAAFDYPFLALAYSILLANVLSDPSSITARVFRARILRATGILSYAIYLFHFLVFSCVVALFRHRYGFFWHPYFSAVLAIGITIALAGISRWFLESPLIRYGHRFTYR